MQLETCYTEVNRDIRCQEQSMVSFRKTNKEVKVDETELYITLQYEG